MALTQINPALFAGATNTTAVIQSNGTTAITVDASQNVGIGVTPSTSASSRKLLQIGGIASVSTLAMTNGISEILSNTVYDGTNFKYITTNYAASFDYNNAATGGFAWRLAPSGTAGNNVTLTEAMRITSAGRVGIGVTAPNQNLDVAGSTRLTYNGGSNYVEFESANNYVGRNGSTGDVDFGVSGGQNINFIISSSTKARLNGNGEFLTGGTTDNGAYNLQCNGTAVWGAGAYVNGSDSRIKNDIAPLNSGLDVVAKLNPVTYKYKETWSKDQSTQTGFIAQELLEALEDKNYVNGIVQQSGEYLSVAYQNIIPILTKAIQELKAIVDAQAVEIAALKAK